MVTHLLHLNPKLHVSRLTIACAVLPEGGSQPGDHSTNLPQRVTCPHCLRLLGREAPAQSEPLTTSLPVPTVIGLAVKRIFAEEVIICPMPGSPHVKWIKRASDGEVLASAWIDPEDGLPEIKLYEWRAIH